jgi:Arc/MetJ family transcription regulator
VHHRRDARGIITSEVGTMRATITVDDELLRELLLLTGTDNRTAAINAAIEGHARRLKIEGLRGLAGKVAIASNEQIEAADLEEARPALAAQPPRGGDRG